MRDYRNASSVPNSCTALRDFSVPLLPVPLFSFFLGVVLICSEMYLLISLGLHYRRSFDESQLPLQRLLDPSNARINTKYRAIVRPRYYTFTLWACVSYTLQGLGSFAPRGSALYPLLLAITCELCLFADLLFVIQLVLPAASSASRTILFAALVSATTGCVIMFGLPGAVNPAR